MDEDIAVLKRKRKFKKILVAAIILLIVGGLIAFYISNKKKGEKIVFETEKLDNGKITATISSTGSLAAVTTVDVGSQVSGTIQEIYVDYNDRVTKGQLLAKIDPATYEAQLQQCEAKLKSGEAQLTQSRADLDNARISVINTEAGIHQAQAGVSRAQADLQSSRGAYLASKAKENSSQAQMMNKEAEYKRAQELYRRELISISEKEDSEMEYKVALADYESAKANVSSAKANIQAVESSLKSAYSDLETAKAKKSSAQTQVVVAQAKVNSARASIAQAQGDYDQVKINLERCLIRSPIDGTVINRKVDEGQTVAASYQTPVLFQLARNLEEMEVTASVDEADIGKVKEGQPVKFTVDAYPNEDYFGKVYQVRTSGTVEENVVTYDVIIRTGNKSLKLKPGMTANIDITVEIKNDVLRIPNAALRFRADKVANFPYPEDMKKDMPGKDKKPNGEQSPEASPKDKKNRDKKDTKDKKGKKDNQDTSVWALQNDKPRRYKVELGISDSFYTEMKKGDLKEGMEVITDAATAGQKSEKNKSSSSGRRMPRP